MKDNLFFVDEQQDLVLYHVSIMNIILKKLNGKIRMTDKVSFKVPFGLLGRLFSPHVLGHTTAEGNIFNHRFEILEKNTINGVTH